MAKRKASTSASARSVEPKKSAAPSMAAKAVAANPAPVARAGVRTAAGRSALTREMIAKRAFQIWERKGKPLGLDLENWRQAERELKAELGL
jgi:hypothetical protein